MVMTGSDLCASTKPWGLQVTICLSPFANLHLQLETVEDIYREFYNQVSPSPAAVSPPSSRATMRSSPVASLCPS